MRGAVLPVRRKEKLKDFIIVHDHSEIKNFLSIGIFKFEPRILPDNFYMSKIKIKYSSDKVWKE